MSKLFYDIMQGFREFAEAADRKEELYPLIEEYIQTVENAVEESLTEAADEQPAAEQDEEPKADDAEAEQLSPVVKIDLNKFKPWGNAAEPYKEIQEADKLYDLEKLIEKGWPEGIEDAALNDLLTDKEFLSAALDVQFKPEEN